MSSSERSTSAASSGDTTSSQAPAGRLARGLITASVILAIGAAAVGLGALPPSPGGFAPVDVEWPFLPSDRLLVVLVVVALTLVVLLSGRMDAVRRRPVVSSRTIGGAVLTASWAALPVAIWADLPVVRGVAFVVAALLPVALAQLIVLSASAAGASPAVLESRRLWATAYLVFAVLASVHVLARDPFLDPRCVARCEPLSPPLASQWLVGAVDLSLRIGSAAAGMGAAVLALLVSRRSRSALSRLTLVLVAVAGSLEVPWAFATTAAAVVGPFPLESPHLLTVRLSAHGALAVSSMVVLVRQMQRQSLLRRMAREIVAVTPPNSVRDIIAAALGDPEAHIAFRVPSGDAWIDELGRPLDPPPSRHGAVISRDGRPVARIDFTAAGLDPRDLEDALGPAAALALEAERTRAEVLLRLRELRVARRRVVEESDAARRRAERDLHDGAQHLLLAATFAIQEGLAHARSAGEHSGVARLEGALADVTGIATDLRTLAHGMYPVLLGDAGLVPALEGLALSSGAATSVDATFHGRAHPSVELTVFRAGAVAVGAANGRPVGMVLTEEAGRIRLRVSGSDLPIEERRALADRVGALGGTLVSTPGSTLLEVPCA